MHAAADKLSPTGCSYASERSRPATGGVGIVGNPAWRTAAHDLAGHERVGTGPATVSITCISDGLSHAVRDTEIASANSYQNGYYSAVCGHVVTPASMVAPDGEPCRVCSKRDPGHEHRCRERR
jgi:hypothetical protein